MADWNAIKAEYITTQNTSYRKLAAKYGVHYTNIAKMAKAENWKQLRQQQADKSLTKTLNAVSSSQAARAMKLQNVADKLLRKVEAMVDGADMITPQNLRLISGTLKDLKDIQMIRSEADMREQEMRIAKLRKETEADAEPPVVTVVMADDLEELSG